MKYNGIKTYKNKRQTCCAQHYISMKIFSIFYLWTLSVPRDIKGLA